MDTEPAARSNCASIAAWLDGIRPCCHFVALRGLITKPSLPSTPNSATRLAAWKAPQTYRQSAGSAPVAARCSRIRVHMYRSRSSSTRTRRGSPGASRRKRLPIRNITWRYVSWSLSPSGSSTYWCHHSDQCRTLPWCSRCSSSSAKRGRRSPISTPTASPCSASSSAGLVSGGCHWNTWSVERSTRTSSTPGVSSAYAIAWYSADASVIGATTDSGAHSAGNPSTSLENACTATGRRQLRSSVSSGAMSSQSSR